MTTIKVKDNQTLLDIALQYYGTAEAMGEILVNNPRIRNDPQSLVATGRELGSFYPDMKLQTGMAIQIDESSSLMLKRVVGKMENDVTTYSL